jgi:RNA polymerase sigma-70 factor, ECF subfamily
MAPSGRVAGSTPAPRPDVDRALAEVVRHEGRRVLATLVRVTGRLDVAEDAVQDATVLALETWPARGVPDVPRAWLTTVARHCATDRLRREAARRGKEARAVVDLSPGHDPDVGLTDEPIVTDDLLRLVFTCCHPALSLEARVALTLRTLVGLEVAEVAALLLVSTATMQRRLVRARRKIVDARVPYRVPSAAELPDRLGAVVQVIRLLFTEGHRPSVADAAIDRARCDEAIRLARLLHGLLPDEPEVSALLGLLLVTDARRGARRDDRGEPVLLADQDRSRWDHDRIAEGVALAATAWQTSADRPGVVTVEAAIAALHVTAPSVAATDWVHVARLYALLEDATPTAVVRANRVVAVAEAEGPATALGLLDGYVRPPTAWPTWWVVRADLLRRLGRHEDAVTDLDRALALDPPPVERRLLTERRERWLS